MGTGSDKKGQDKKRIRERDCENCKAGRQTSECEATLVWTCKKERRPHGKKMMEMAVPGRRKRGRPRRRWMDLVREDMGRVGAREGDGDYCRAVATPSREKPKEEDLRICCTF